MGNYDEDPTMSQGMSGLSIQDDVPVPSNSDARLMTAEATDA
jgi:hypothetical protein